MTSIQSSSEGRYQTHKVVQTATLYFSWLSDTFGGKKRDLRSMTHGDSVKGQPSCLPSVPEPRAQRRLLAAFAITSRAKRRLMPRREGQRHGRDLWDAGWTGGPAPRCSGHTFLSKGGRPLPSTNCVCL